ncbi:MAG: PEP-CTERM sorting domain-containing protein [Phycisphaerae bacterium]|nr:PEP-CTERM sorting domain-containing protein [Phycisphaerae bacterium]
MAHIARLFCVLAVLSLSTSAFATMITITDNESVNNVMNTSTTDLTIARLLGDPLFGGMGLLSITNTTADPVDYFMVDLVQGDYLMVNTSILDPTFATTVTLYNGSGTAVGTSGQAAYLDNLSSSNAGTHYIGVTGTGTAAYMMTFSISNHTPEPATMSLLAIGGIALLKRRRKR